MNQTTQIVMQPMQWGHIPDVHDIEPLSERDADCLLEIRDVFMRHGVLDRFAISLIHKHFDIASTEQMVEFTDPKNRILTIKPVSDNEALNTLETTWRFSAETTGMQPLTICVFRCYYNPNSTPQHVGQHGGG